MYMEKVKAYIPLILVIVGYLFITVATFLLGGITLGLTTLGVGFMVLGYLLGMAHGGNA